MKKFCFFLLAFSFSVGLSNIVTAQVITTIAGNGFSGSGGDGGPATAASLSPLDIATDGAGNVFILDASASTVRKVNNAGIISTYAGGGFSAITNGVPATSVYLYYAASIAVDGSGNVYIADQYDGYVLQVNTAGNINIYAGNGFTGYSGDGGAATSASLDNPRAVAFDATGNLYIAESYSNTIRKVNTSGIITTVAGNYFGGGGYSGDGGAATAASLNSPSGVAVDVEGNIYIADFYNSCIRMVNSSGKISTVAGIGMMTGYSGDGGPATNAKLYEPVDVAVDEGGNIYISDGYYNNRIRQVNASGIISTVAGTGMPGFSGDGGPATAAKINHPYGLTLDNNGFCLIADYGNNRVRKFETVSIFGPNTICIGTTDTLRSLAPSGGVWSVSNSAIATVSSSTGILTAVSLGVDTIYYTTGTKTIKKVMTVVAPGAGTISGNNTFCINSHDTIVASVSGGSWSSVNGYATISNISDSGIVNGIASGLEIIDYSVTNACGSYTTVYPINIIPLPTGGKIIGHDSICVGHPVTLHDSAAGGVWSTSTGTIDSVSASTGVVHGITPGLGIINYTVTNQCGTATKLFPVDVLTTAECLNYNSEVKGVSSSLDELKVFPNPNSGSFSIVFTSTVNENVNYTITDLLGEKVSSFTALANNQVEITAGLSPGIYFVSATTAHGKFTQKITVF